MRIPRSIVAEMIRHARAGAPKEACGLVGGRLEGGELVARRFRPTPNEADSEVFYTVPPLEILRFERQLDREGLELVAVFHSHPQTRAYPSPTDVRLAYYPEAVYLILSLASDPPDLRGFRIREGRVAEVAIVVEEDGGGA
ncbi:MAG: M67 family metallopeptidase [Clostridia bacterium]|nr:M67 family metallopeptidase [Clostridia bacterium]